MKLIIYTTEKVERPTATGFEIDYETSREEYDADAIYIEHQKYNGNSTWFHIYKNKNGHHEREFSIEFDAENEDYMIIQ